MANLVLHHVSIVVRDLDRAVSFYTEVFGLPRIQRPPFKSQGAWIGVEDRQVHLILYPQGTFRAARKIDINDQHFAFCTTDFEAQVTRLAGLGFREDAPEGDPMQLLVMRNGLASFSQLYLLDPDNNMIEINGAPL